MTLRRDAKGRFRKPTDEERWPNPDERERMQRIRGLFDCARAAYREFAVNALKDVEFASGKVWAKRRFGRSVTGINT